TPYLPGNRDDVRRRTRPDRQPARRQRHAQTGDGRHHRGHPQRRLPRQGPARPGFADYAGQFAVSGASDFTRPLPTLLGNVNSHSGTSKTCKWRYPSSRCHLPPSSGRRPRDERPFLCSESASWVEPSSSSSPFFRETHSPGRSYPSKKFQRANGSKPMLLEIAARAYALQEWPEHTGSASTTIGRHELAGSSPPPRGARGPRSHRPARLASGPDAP